MSNGTSSDEEHIIYCVMQLGKNLSRYVSPRGIGELFDIPPKVISSICDKWNKKGIFIAKTKVSNYNYGVSNDLGWLEDLEDE